MIAFYGSEDCPDCRTARNWMTAYGSGYDFRDPARDPRAAARLAALGLGDAHPVLVWPDGRTLVSPTTNELAAAHATGEGRG